MIKSQPALTEIDTAQFEPKTFSFLDTLRVKMKCKKYCHDGFYEQLHLLKLERIVYQTVDHISEATNK